MEIKRGGGDEGIRTLGLCVANAPLSHLSYIPTQRNSKLSSEDFNSYFHQGFTAEAQRAQRRVFVFPARWREKQK